MPKSLATALPGADRILPKSLTARSLASSSSFCSSSMMTGQTVTSEVESTTATASSTSAYLLLSGWSPAPLVLSASVRKCCTAS